MDGLAGASVVLERAQIGRQCSDQPERCSHKVSTIITPAQMLPCCCRPVSL